MTPLSEAAARLSAALGGGAAADLAAASLIEADAIGQPRFGLAMLDEWQPAARSILGDVPQSAVVWLDCAQSFAPVAVAEAALHLSETARRFGVAAVFLRGVRGFGRLAPFLRHLADQGLLAMAGAEGPPFVAPWQGDKPVIGTNPFGLAVGRGADRVVIDIASSAATMAAIKAARANRTTLPEGIALDAAGRPTTLAAEVAALLPRGGQLGSLLGLIVELLAGVAGGGRGDAKGRGVFLLALDPALAGEASDWQAKLAALQEDWHAGGGYWPQGRPVSPDTPLSPDILARLDAHLLRLAAAQDR